MSCLETLFIPSKSYNLLSGCARSNLVRCNSTHIESNIHMKLKQETRAMQILGGNGKRNYYKGRASGNAGGQERSNILLSVSPATTSHHRRNGSQDLNFQWLQNLLETLSQTILLGLQNHTPFPRLIINQGSRPGNSCEKFLQLLFFLSSVEREWASFWFQLENLKDSPPNSQLGKNMAMFTGHLRCSETPHLCKASQKPQFVRWTWHL